MELYGFANCEDTLVGTHSIVKAAVIVGNLRCDGLDECKGSSTCHQLTTNFPIVILLPMSQCNTTALVIPSHIAARRGNVSTCLLLLDKGADINQHKGGGGRRVRIESYDGVNSQEAGGIYAITMTDKHGHVELAKILHHQSTPRMMGILMMMMMMDTTDYA